MALADYAIDQPIEAEDEDAAPVEPDANAATTEEAIDKLRRWADPLVLPRLGRRPPGARARPSTGTGVPSRVTRTRVLGTPPHLSAHEKPPGQNQPGQR